MPRPNIVHHPSHKTERWHLAESVCTLNFSFRALGADDLHPPWHWRIEIYNQKIWLSPAYPGSSVPLPELRWAAVAQWLRDNAVWESKIVETSIVGFKLFPTIGSSDQGVPLRRRKGL
ncbi:hypothetical protein TNCV_3294841 [Trichonephila clavipes]|nr:hypothetical protein TNCV_3294841 [Trichonephila clavipes]